MASELAGDFETVRQMAAGEDFAVRALEMGSARLELQNQLYHGSQAAYGKASAALDSQSEVPTSAISSAVKPYSS